MNIQQAIHWAEKKLAEAGIENAGTEAGWILSPHVPSIKSRAELFLKREPLADSAWQNYQSHISSRINGTPLAYLLESQEFCGLEFYVNADVLVPRPDTEILVETAAKKLRRTRQPKILDIGTGSGNIAVALAKYFPESKISAVDISEKALIVARKNAETNAVSRQINFERADLFPSHRQMFDLIVSNPPYIRSGELPSLQKEIQREPRIALDGGADGLRIVEPLIRQAIHLLTENGFLCVEIGYDQDAGVLSLMKEARFQNLESIKDEAGIDRVICGQKI